MAKRVGMPKLGMSMKQGTVTRWFVQEGEEVSKGELLAEIESDKITTEIEASASGIVHPVVTEGTTVDVKKLIAWITEPGEAVPAEDAQPAPEQKEAAGPEQQPAPTAPAEKERTTGDFVPASPIARRLAREHGIDLAEVEGTGRNGTVTETDVQRALDAQQPAAEEAKFVPASPAARRLAREHGIDLGDVEGTGRKGTVVEGDVERFLDAQAPTAREIRPVERTSFYSDRHSLDAVLYTPDEYEAGEARAGIVFCVGYTYVKELVIPEMAKWLTRAGYVSLIFDYRGFGKSEGPRWRLIPHEQVTDIRNAITFLGQQPQVDASRIGLVGLSLGGANAIYTAGVDERVQAAVSIEGPGDGRRWLQSLRRYDEWLDFLDRIEQDRVQRVLEGESTRVDSLDIVLPDPESKAFLEQVYEEFPEMQCELPLESADALIQYSPERIVQNVAPRPLLLIHGRNDRLVPAREAHNVYAAAGEPKELVLIPEMEHLNWVLPDHPIFERVMETTTNWFAEHLPAR